MKHDSPLSFLNAMSDGRTAHDRMAQEELELRRKLLFRLLARFDFDNPGTQYEMISSPVPITEDRSSVDNFFHH